MLETFWEGAGSKVADRILRVLLGPALVFWAAGAVLWIARFDPTLAVPKPLVGNEQLAIFIVIPTLVAVSAALEQVLALPTVRLLEGYWPRWFPPRAALIRANDVRAQHARDAWQALAERDPATLSATERAAFVELDLQLRRFPPNAADRMPTMLGNVLRAAERRPTEKYGLDAVICWPRLWLLLPNEVREEISEARSALDTGARIFIWGFFFLFWAVLQLWTVPFALIAMYTAYRWLIGAAETYGDLLESAFDLFRARLYESLRWPLPEGTDEEFTAGQMLTEYFFRGSVIAAVRYAIDQEPTAGANPRMNQPYSE